MKNEQFQKAFFFFGTIALIICTYAIIQFLTAPLVPTQPIQKLNPIVPQVDYNKVMQGYYWAGEPSPAFFSDYLNAVSTISGEQICLQVPDAENRFSVVSTGDTGSMLPALSTRTILLMYDVRSVEELHIGDIVVFERPSDGLAPVHRIIGIGNDANGWFAEIRGDNTTRSDGKFRIGQIKTKVIGVLN